MGKQKGRHNIKKKRQEKKLEQVREKEMGGEKK